MKTEIWTLGDPPDSVTIQKAAEWLKEGKLVAFPTETVYGIGVLPHNEIAAEKVFALKKRSFHKPFAWHLANTKEIGKLNLERNPLFEKVAETFYPAPFTSIVRDKKGETVGIRIPEDPIAQEFISEAGGAILATSANLSDKPSSTDAAMVKKYFDGKIDLILDGGPTRYRGDSTVVDFTTQPFKIIRRGVYSEIEFEIKKVEMSLAKKKLILIVCTGNTCRSPMAEIWLKSELKRHGLEKGMEVVSCGVYARRGSHASFEADLILQNEALDLSEHHSQPLTKELIDNATKILVMSKEHRDSILELYPGAVERVKILGVDDPIGGDIQIYKDCFEEIKKAIKENWSWITE